MSDYVLYSQYLLRIVNDTLKKKFKNQFKSQILKEMRRPRRNILKLREQTPFGHRCEYP